MNSVKITLAQPQISAFGPSSKVSTEIIQTEGDTNILLKHSSM